MTYEYKSKKIIAVISDNLESWQAMNTLGHMAVSLGANKDSDLMGREILIDKSNTQHLGIARFGFIIKKGNTRDIFSLVDDSKKHKDILTIDFPREMLETRHDDELAVSISNKNNSDFEYLGVLLYGDSNIVDTLTKEFKLWN